MATIGRYEVMRTLGEGSTGSVYLVRHPDLNVEYALKVLRPDLCADPRVAASFQREAETLLKFSHPGCAQVRDFGHLPDGSYYLAMEFCQGETLAERLSRCNRLTVPIALSITEAVLDTLEAVHGVGIVHRDIKPDNVLLSDDFSGPHPIRLLDFGVARRAYLEVTGDDDRVEGTPEYMAPEQIYGAHEIDGRADLYSVGIVLYEMLTGYPPFREDSTVGTLCAHVNAAVPPIPEHLGVPQSVQEVVERALQKNRRNRFSSAREFRLALAELRKVDNGESVDCCEDGALALEPRGTTAEGDAHRVSSPSGRVICLDDDAGFLNVLIYLLQREAIDATGISSIEEAYEQIVMGGVSLIVLDVQMPMLSGTRVCRLLKQTHPEIPILLLSSLPSHELVLLAQESRADGYLLKASQPAGWIRRMKTFLPKMSNEG